MSGVSNHDHDRLLVWPVPVRSRAHYCGSQSRRAQRSRHDHLMEPHIFSEVDQLSSPLIVVVAQTDRAFRQQALAAD